MVQYVDVYFSLSTYHEIIEIIRESAEGLDNYYEIEDRVNLVQLMEELEEEDNGKKNKEYIQWHKNQKEISKLEKEYKDLINNLCESFDIKYHQLNYFLEAIIDLFPNWNSKYMLVSASYYLSTKDDFLKINEKWDLLEKYDLPVKDLMFFYSTIIKNKVDNIEI